ncbi:MAG: hypothetical protein AMXMBFR7_24510 [Planctomycetota bacterium]
MSDSVDIQVSFLDFTTGFEISRQVIPHIYLPATFELETDMDLEGFSWKVMRAEPKEIEEIKKARTLKLFLTKNESRIVNGVMSQHGFIHFSIPSINNSVGSLDQFKCAKGKDVLEIMEDSWRDFEFISSTYEKTVDRNLRMMGEILRAEPKGPWKRMLLRVDLPYPLLSVDLNRTHLMDFSPYAKEYDGLAYFQNPNAQDTQLLVQDSYAYETKGGLALYGREQDKKLLEVCIARYPSSGITATDLASITKFLIRYDLLLVHWCSASLYSATPSEGLKRLQYNA